MGDSESILRLLVRLGCRVDGIVNLLVTGDTWGWMQQRKKSVDCDHQN